MKATYEHTQRAGWPFWAVVLAMFAIAVMFGWLLFEAPTDEQGQAAGYWVLLGTGIFSVGLMAAAAAMMYSLTVRIEDEQILIRFGGGVWRKRFHLIDIVSAQPVRNHWLYGWGIHWGSSGWLYNIAGFNAVELTFRNGRHARIGTDEPEELAGAIRSRIQPKD
ncbi:MAG: hypothetical protein JW828_12565 [Sedimentisphaerales bacterium]|nr:hypothetical protein [Sedimentisphaerales bacterium]